MIHIGKSLEEEKEMYIQDIPRKMQFVPEPTYFFEPGDRVLFGNFKKCVVEEVFGEGKAYLIKCVAEEIHSDPPKEYETYIAVSWLEIRPIHTIKKTNFAKNNEVKISYYNMTIESLLHRCYSFGVDMNPDYQRGYLWNITDKIYLLDSIYNNYDIGKFVFVQLAPEKNKEFTYEILDGKQRLSTLMAFYENRIPFNGRYFNELSGTDKRRFLDFTISVAEIDDADRNTIIKTFIAVNRAGKKMSKPQLERIEKLITKFDKEGNNAH